MKSYEIIVNHMKSYEIIVNHMKSYEIIRSFRRAWRWRRPRGGHTGARSTAVHRSNQHALVQSKVTGAFSSSAGVGRFYCSHCRVQFLLETDTTLLENRYNSFWKQIQLFSKQKSGKLKKLTVQCCNRYTYLCARIVRCKRPSNSFRAKGSAALPYRSPARFSREHCRELGSRVAAARQLRWQKFVQPLPRGRMAVGKLKKTNGAML